MTVQFGRTRVAETPQKPTFCPPSYDFTDMKQVIATAQTLTHDEATQVVRYVTGRYGTRPSTTGKPEDAAAALSWRLFQTMASMADKKQQLGTPVADQIRQEANTQYLGSCFNRRDQYAALQSLIQENPMVLLELAKGILGQEPGDIAKFLLHWQWKAHNTGAPTMGLPQWHPVPNPLPTPAPTTYGAVDPRYLYWAGTAAAYGQPGQAYPTACC